MSPSLWVRVYEDSFLYRFVPAKKNRKNTFLTRWNSDPIFPIMARLGRWCQLGFIRLKITVGHVGDGFPWRKQCILLATAIVHLIHPFLYIWGGRNRWMGVDGIGWRALQNKQCTRQMSSRRTMFVQWLWHCNKRVVGSQLSIVFYSNF